MRRSQLDKVYYKNKLEKYFKAYKEQKNFAAERKETKGNSFPIILIYLF